MRVLPNRTLLKFLAFGLLGVTMLTRPDPGQAASAETPQERGLEIATKVDERDAGFEDSVVRTRMILRNSRGDESIREMRFFALENPAPGEGDKTLIVVDAPADVDGTVLLTHAAILEPDDQWIYLPALKRVKRISSVNKSGPFMGSEFAYEDMGAQEVEKYRYKWLRDTSCPATGSESTESLTCAVIERRPKYEHSGYTRQVVWVDLQEYRIHKIDYYDRKNALLKTLTLRRYGLYLDQFWRAHEMDMVNHQTGKETTLLTSEYRFQSGLDDGMFSKSRMDKIQ